MSEIDSPRASGYHPNRTKVVDEEPVLRQDQDLALEQAPPGYSRLFLLAVLIVFLAFAFNSIPNVISANNPKADSVQSGHVPRREGFPVGQRPGVGLDNTLKPDEPLPLGNHDIEPMSGAVGEGYVDPNRVASQRQEGTQDMGDTSTQHTQLPPSMKTSPTHHSGQQQQQDQAQRTSLMEDVDIRSLVRASFSLVFGISLWFLRTIYQWVGFIVSIPVEVAGALLEKPYQMTKDICKAFLPVYSFFSAAAMIGIVIGGCALWIAQLLISAIGADERQSQVVLHASTAPRHPRYVVAQGPRRVPESKSITSQASAEALRRSRTASADVNHIKSTIPQNHTRPITAPQDALIAKGRSSPIEYEDQDDDDDDDDDDDWDRI
ncbi:hypothetical protein B0O80DRAFT_464047 [Mortierella sp. GBAus27b]|nr:hypothetical protein BGX31_007769 [Mortierella sp. GBA43]KAI8347939.1 hypothetical protein B0O80DRAFT_464047 [Mortierella sp. GBAus27b]